MVQKYHHTHTPLSELLEWDAVREALSADTDPLQDSITPQLVQHQVGGQLTGLRTSRQQKVKNQKNGKLNSVVSSVLVRFLSYLLLVVGDDAAEEVGVGVPQRGHQLRQRLLVKLTDGPEHSLLRLQPRRSEIDRPAVLSGRHLVQTHDSVHWTKTHSGASVISLVERVDEFLA